MGVHGLWKIIEPTASPVKLDSLRGKTLAIDASIWIYHFLKAMRDPKGTILTAAHIIGFFRRICKLLFFEIRPVFVFDGAAPILKKQTTNKRSERRIGREQNARSTANKLLTLQLQRIAANNKKISTENKKDVEIVGTVPENAVYMEEQQQTNTQPDHSNPRDDLRTQNKPFVKTDQYHLPELDSIGPLRTDDQRLLTQDELDEYSKQFTTQARAGFIDTSLIDFHSSEFQQLPIETQYQLLNMARLKSRLRMGYTAEELNKMFPDRMDFSKFQINRVAQRNFFTQKLMNIAGLEEDLTRRVSSEKNKEYILKKTDQGWSLTLEDNDTTKNSNSNSEGLRKEEAVEHVDSDEEPEFEDVDLSPETIVLNEGEVTPQSNEKIDLTAEESSKLDELFGFEAHLSRNDLYNKLLDEIDEESETDLSATKKPINSRSILFEDHRKDQEKNPKDNEQPAVPWFKSFNSNFKEMEIREEPNQPNFVPIDEYIDPESEPESEQDNDFTHKVEPKQNKHVISEPPGDLNTEWNITKSPQSILFETSKKPPTVHDMNFSEASRSEPQRNDQPPIPVKNTDSERPLCNESVKKTDSKQPQLKEPEVNVSPSTENTVEQESRIELSEDAAELAEQEAKMEEEEEEDIAGMLIAEAEENERFARQLAQQSEKGWSAEEQRDYENQIITLRSQFSKETRDADNISNEMIQECQELLQLFGIPYITAPAEAEAQCAELRQLKLVDGVVTDDGDTFLFDTNAMVYRNMFSQSKFVEFYSGKQIHQKLGLSRKSLIELAFLLGSDYTEGILGIGPVTGVELLAEFGGLKEFAEWWSQAQRFPDIVDINTPLKRRLLRQFKSKIFLPDDFPSSYVIDAYMHPLVDKDPTKFSWGSPNLDGLRKFMATTAGWDVEKTNVALLPVVQEAKRKDLLRKTTESYDQTSLDDYYETVVRNPELNSKRAARAATKMRKRNKSSDN